MNDERKKVILEAVSKMLDEEHVEVLFISKPSIADETVQSRGIILVIETGTQELLPLLKERRWLM